MFRLHLRSLVERRSIGRDIFEHRQPLVQSSLSEEIIVFEGYQISFSGDYRAYNQGPKINEQSSAAYDFLRRPSLLLRRDRDSVESGDQSFSLMHQEAVEEVSASTLPKSKSVDCDDPQGTYHTSDSRGSCCI